MKIKSMNINPNRAFRDDIDITDVLEACGLIPTFVSQCDADDSFVKEMERKYGFGALRGIKDTVINEEGQWTYPGDPNLDPLIHLITENDDELRMYPHALIAIREHDAESWFCTRMD